MDILLKEAVDSSEWERGEIVGWGCFVLSQKVINRRAGCEWECVQVVVQPSSWLGQFTSLSPQTDLLIWAIPPLLSLWLLWPHVNLSLVTQACQPSSSPFLFNTFILPENSKRYCGREVVCGPTQLEIDWKRLRDDQKGESPERNLRHGNGWTLHWARKPHSDERQSSINKSLKQTCRPRYENADNHGRSAPSVSSH